MEQYIKREKVLVEKLTCSHPKVINIWETGGLSAIENNSEMVRNIHIMLKDFTRHDFTDKGEGKAIEEAEQFLSSLPNE